MNISSKNNTVKLEELSLIELVALLKFDFPITLNYHNGTQGESVKIDKIDADYEINDKKFDLNQTLEYISGILKEYLFDVSIDNIFWKEYEHLISIMDRMNKNLINACTRIGYHKIDQMYYIIFPYKKGLPNEVYYFDSNDSILMFNENGPKLMVGETTSIEDLLID